MKPLKVKNYLYSKNCSLQCNIALECANLNRGIRLGLHPGSLKCGHLDKEEVGHHGLRNNDHDLDLEVYEHFAHREDHLEDLVHEAREEAESLRSNSR